MTASHRSAGRNERWGRLLRAGVQDSVQAVRDWRPPELPEPEDGPARREARPRRFPEPVWGRTPLARRARNRVQRGMLFPLLTALGRPEVVGRHHLDALAGPCIFAPNHVSHSDAPLVLQALPGRLRERTLVPAAADYFFERRWLSVLVTLGINAVPFDRRNEIADSVRRCERFLRHGFSIVLFPEGTRSRDGRLRGFKAGVAHLAVNTGAPVVPIYLQGSHRLLGRGHAVPRPSQVVVHVGPPLAAAEGETARRFNERIEEAVASLASTARGWGHRDGVPDARPWTETWRASARDTGAQAPGEDEWRAATAAPSALPPPATPLGSGGWIARWRSATPR